MFALVGAVLLAASIGIPIGLVGGFFGGWRDALLMRFIDVLLALPGILLAMALISLGLYRAFKRSGWL